MHTRAQIVENSTLFRHAEHDALKIPVSSVSLTETLFAASFYNTSAF